MKVLYISYDGALDPLGRSQVIPYLEGLTQGGHRFDLLTFEKAARWKDRFAMQARLTQSNIAWHPLRYHKKFSALATTYDLARAFATSAALHLKRKFDVVHARSYPSALVAWRLSRLFNLPFIFDMRGFYADERIEGGMWPKGSPLYRLTKTLEQHFLRDASAVVTLTEASRPVLQQWLADAGGTAEPVVIPTCVDTDRFAPAGGARKQVLAYLGSIGSWYMLDEMLAFGKVFLERAPEASLLFVANDGVDEVKARARAIGVERLVVRSVAHEEVPAALSEATATFHFIRPTFSKTASAATKFGESLALALPVVVNPGVGDSADIVKARGVGVVVPRFDNAAYEIAAAELLALLSDPDVRARCRQTALDHFSLSDGIAKFASLYAGLQR